MELSQEQLNELKELLKPKEQGNEGNQQASAFTVNIGGQAYQVSSQDEAQRLIDQLEAQRGQEIESERIKALAAQQREEQLQASLPKSGQQDGFNKEEYARLFLEDPRKASKYMLQHDPEQLSFYQGLVQQIAAVKQESAAAQFVMSHRDYEATPENYKALEGIINQYKLPWDLNGMNLAYEVGRAQGFITTSGNKAQQQQSQQDDQEEAFVAAPRVSRRRSNQNSEPDIAEQFAQLSPDAMKAYLEKNFAQK